MLHVSAPRKRRVEPGALLDLVVIGNIADEDVDDVLLGFVAVVVSHIQRIGCQPEKNYFTRWPIPLVVC